jgi:hypothetical protein
MPTGADRTVKSRAFRIAGALFGSERPHELGFSAMSRGHRTTQLAAIALALAMLALGACSDDAPSVKQLDRSSSDAASSAAPSEDPRLTAAKADLRVYFDMFIRLEMKPDPDDPEIPLRTVEPETSSLRTLMARVRSENRHLVIKPERPFKFDILDASITGEQITIRACFVDGSTTVSSLRPDEVLAENLSTIRYIFTMAHDNVWKVSSVDGSLRLPGEIKCENMQ